MTNSHGPLPQWDQVGDYGSGVYEAEDPHGVTWQLWLVRVPDITDPLPPGYRLAPRDDREHPVLIPRDHGLYSVLDAAGMHIAASAVREDPEGAALQLALTDSASIREQAREAVTGVLAWYAEQIGIERRKPEPDDGRIEVLLAARRAVHGELQRIDSGNREEIEEITFTYETRLRRLTA